MRPGEVHHPHPGGDEGRAPLRAGQQRAHLRGVTGVVQHHQDAAAVQDRAVEGGPFLQRVGDGRVRRAEGAEEGAQDRLRLRRPRARALEVDVQLPVGEGRPRQVGDVHGEGGLADAADAGQRRDGHDAARRAVPGRRGQDVAQLADEGGAAGEVRDRRGQLCRPDGGHRRLRGRCGGLGQRRVGAQDALLEFLEAGARVDAEFVGEQAPRVRVDGQRLGLASAAVQGQHQQLAQAFAQRVGRGERRQLRDRLGVAALLEVHVQPVLQELQPPLLQTRALRLRVRARYARQDLAVPQGQRPAQQVTGVAQVAGVPRLLRPGGQVLGRVQVQGAVARQAHRVPAGLAHQDARVQDLPQPGGVGPQRGQGLRRRLFPTGRRSAREPWPCGRRGAAGRPAAPVAEESRWPAVHRRARHAPGRARRS